MNIHYSWIIHLLDRCAAINNSIWLKHSNYIWTCSWGLSHFFICLRLWIMALYTFQFFNIIFKVKHDCIKCTTFWAVCSCDESFFNFVNHGLRHIFGCSSWYDTPIQIWVLSRIRLCVTKYKLTVEIAKKFITGFHDPIFRCFVNAWQ